MAGDFLFILLILFQKTRHNIPFLKISILPAAVISFRRYLGSILNELL